MIILSAVVIAMDATYRSARKADLVSPDHGYDVLMDGGMMGMLSEFNEIISMVPISQFTEQFEIVFDQFWLNCDSY